MTIYVPLMDSPAAGATQLDALTGTVVFLAGLDRAEAAAAFGAYQQRSARSVASFDAAALKVTDGATTIQFAWETNIATGQDLLWGTVWTELAIENRLCPSWDLVLTFEAIIKAQRAA